MAEQTSLFVWLFVQDAPAMQAPAPIVRQEVRQVQLSSDCDHTVSGTHGKSLVGVGLVCKPRTGSSWFFGYVN